MSGPSIVYVYREGKVHATHAVNVREIIQDGGFFSVCTCGWMQKGDSPSFQAASDEAGAHLTRVQRANLKRP